MGKTEKMIYLECKIDPSFNGIIIFEDHPSYSLFKSELFSKSGLAFILSGQRVVIFDGERILTENLSAGHLAYIFAHEIGHYILEHANKRRSIRIEMEADWAAIQICSHLRRKSATMLAKYEFFNRYGLGYLEATISEKKKMLVQRYLKTLNI